MIAAPDSAGLIEHEALAATRGPAAGERVDVGPPGHTVRVSWAGADGATKAEVDSASATIGPVLSVTNEQIATTAIGAEHEIAIAQGKRVLALHLDGFERVQRIGEGAESEEIPLTSESQLGSGNRLVVSIPDTKGELAAAFAIPAIGARGKLPSMFTGASFGGGVLNLPEVDARRLRLSLTENDSPEDWNSVEMRLASILTVTLGTVPADLELTGPDGTVLWAFPGEMQLDTPDHSVDFRIPLQAALNKALAEGRPLDFPLILTGAPGSQARFRLTGTRGALVRSFSGITTIQLTGDPVATPLAGPRLADETPASVIGDLTVKYAGIRLLENVSDPIPAAGEAAGIVVTDQPVSRALPSLELPLARAGVIGRAPIECELSVQLIDLPACAPLGKPGVVKLAPSAAIQTVWVELPETTADSSLRGISVRANTGRFFWASGAQPLLRLAIRDADPRGRPLRMGGQEVMRITEPKMHLPDRSFPAAAFRSRAPVMESDLFLTAEISDLELRYRR
jgi:hypothetical protein